MLIRATKNVMQFCCRSHKICDRLSMFTPFEQLFLQNISTIFCSFFHWFTSVNNNVFQNAPGVERILKKAKSWWPSTRAGISGASNAIPAERCFMGSTWARTACRIANGTTRSNSVSNVLTAIGILAEKFCR